jgi:alpha-amylase/alpha-mannosidase (GH57 family)
MNKYICIHGHFYQPPRENPWLETIEVQDSAYPYRDWNERITAECYNPNTASRIMAEDRKIIDIINNYAHISFNFGPTLLSWMEDYAPEVYQRILDADKESMQRFSGHGSAIAQVYNHLIMPLANTHDKRTQIAWGNADFMHRFGREPEAMWLAETAVDNETLELLAEHKIRYTILAPHQARRIKKIGDPDDHWTDTPDASIDPKMPYLCRLPSGKEIVLFFYDGPVSHDLSFGDMLQSGDKFVSRLMQSFNDEKETPQLVHIATDGETYGHHARYGDMALAYCLHMVTSQHLANVTIYGEYLEKFPPTHQVEINENTSWSCMHGVERWRSECGCNSGRQGWNQKWRAPLRETLDWLRDVLIPVYEQEAGKFTNDPWALRDAYIDVILDRSDETIEKFFSGNLNRSPSGEEKTKLLILLEMQRHTLLMYTSCGWFFDEVSGIETVQVMLYAARVMQLAKEAVNLDLEAEFVSRLEEIPSNIPELGNAARAFALYVRPSVVDFYRVGAHYAISALFDGMQPDQHVMYSYLASDESIEKVEAGKWKMVVGKTRLKSRIIQYEITICFGFVHLGDHNVIGGVRGYAGEEKFEEMKTQMKDAFVKLDIAEIVSALDNQFGNHSYTIWHLFKEETRKVFAKVTEPALKDIDGLYRQIYETNYPIMQAMRDALMPLPLAFTTALQYTINLDLKRVLADVDPIDTEKLDRVYAEVKKWNVPLDRDGLRYAAEKRVNRLMETLSLTPMNEDVIRELEVSLETMKKLGIDLHPWKAQNTLFDMWGKHLPPMKAKTGKDAAAKEWVDTFYKIADELQIRLE